MGISVSGHQNGEKTTCYCTVAFIVSLYKQRGGEWGGGGGPYHPLFFFHKRKKPIHFLGGKFSCCFIRKWYLSLLLGLTLGRNITRGRPSLFLPVIIRPRAGTPFGLFTTVAVIVASSGTFNYARAGQVQRAARRLSRRYPEERVVEGPSFYSPNSWRRNSLGVPYVNMRIREYLSECWYWA